jgi:hypothetical protein
LHVNDEDAKALLPWFYLFRMTTHLLQQCDKRLDVSSPEFLDNDGNDVDHQRSTMHMTEILVWADTAAAYGHYKTLDYMMKELKKVVSCFP